MSFLLPLAEAAGAGEAAATEGASTGETLGRAAEFQQGQKDHESKAKQPDITVGSLLGDKNG